MDDPGEKFKKRKLEVVSGPRGGLFWRISRPMRVNIEGIINKYAIIRAPAEMPNCR